MKTKLKKNRKLSRILKKPYVKNRITFTSELYPNANSSKSLITAGASGTFSVRLLPLLASLSAAYVVLLIMSKFKMHK